jgi:Ni,Fe-hydrogenase I large subunit
LLLHRLRRLALACIDNPTPEHGGLRCGDIGIGWARTARGLLLHLTRVEPGNVTAYRILPPTFWNAAPNGIMVAALAGLATEQAARCAEQLLLLLDPCAPFEIEVTLADATLQPTASTGSAAHA